MAGPGVYVMGIEQRYHAVDAHEALRIFRVVVAQNLYNAA